MQRFLLVIAVFLIVITIKVDTAYAVSESVDASTGSPVLCLPGIYLVDPQDCQPLGPSSYLTSLASQGITLPLKPLHGKSLDISFGQVPFNYAILNEGSNPVYATLDDAVAEVNPIRSISAGNLKYISYIDFADTSNGRWFLLKSGGWVRASSRVSVPRSFPGGLTFNHTPLRTFGWLLPIHTFVETKQTPGYGINDLTGHQIMQYDTVQIFDVEEVDGYEWFMVGPDEWIEGRFVGRVIPNTTPPDGVNNGRWIEVNLFEQTLSVYEQNEMVYATLIASGLEPFYTQPGLFPIYKKHVSTPMSGAFEADRSDFYYLEDVPWTMYYDEARALHGAYWRTAFGFPQSHGCVNLSPTDAHWLFEWAQENDWVYVWDPSGQTPTDPQYYTQGGA
jgi:hypothetical protein